MTYIATSYDEKIENILKSWWVGVLATDTLYGLVWMAKNPETIKKIYQLKWRDENKPFIVLISDIAQLNDFWIFLDFEQKKILEKLFSQPLSVMLENKNIDFDYLTKKSWFLAFRKVQKQNLQDLIWKVWPLVAPSANPQWLDPAINLLTIQKYFPQLDFIVDEWDVGWEPSTIVKLVWQEIFVVRVWNILPQSLWDILN